nr:hypothetical protein [Elizabethkingia sp. ASV34]
MPYLKILFITYFCIQIHRIIVGNGAVIPNPSTTNEQVAALSGSIGVEN